MISCLEDEITDFVVNTLYPWEVLPLVCVPLSFSLIELSNTKNEYLGIHLVDTIGLLKIDEPQYRTFVKVSEDLGCILCAKEWLEIKKIPADLFLDLVFNPTIHEDEIFTKIRPLLIKSISKSLFYDAISHSNRMVMIDADVQTALSSILQIRMAIMKNWAFKRNKLDPQGFLNASVDQMRNFYFQIRRKCYKLLDLANLPEERNWEYIEQADRFIANERLRLC